jgi:hypothetical protein
VTRVLPLSEGSSADGDPTYSGGDGGSDSSNRQSNGTLSSSHVPSSHGGRTLPTPSGLFHSVNLQSMMMMMTLVTLGGPPPSSSFGLPGFLSGAEASQISPSSYSWVDLSTVHGSSNNSSSNGSSMISFELHENTSKEQKTAAKKNDDNDTASDDDQEEPKVILISEEFDGLAKTRYENNNNVDGIDKEVIDELGGGITMTTTTDSYHQTVSSSVAPDLMPLSTNPPLPPTITTTTLAPASSSTKSPVDLGGGGVCECYCPCMVQASDYYDDVDTSSGSGFLSGIASGSGGYISDHVHNRDFAHLSILDGESSGSGSGGSGRAGDGYEDQQQASPTFLLETTEGSGSGEEILFKASTEAWRDPEEEIISPALDNYLKDLTDENYIPVFHPPSLPNCSQSLNGGNGGNKIKIKC